MSLARRALKEESKVLIIDDFMHVGGTIQGMMDLLRSLSDCTRCRRIHGVLRS